MAGTFWRQIIAIVGILNLVLGQDSPTCGLDCIANVSGSNCARSAWSCLCRDQIWLENLATCVQQACNTTDYDVTIGAVADICGILNAPATISPYGTATPISNNPVFSTVALSESLSTVTSGTIPRSSTHEITGMSSSTSLGASLPSSSSARATSTSTTTNIAQRHDLARSAVQGIAVALLGLALYL